MSNSQIEVKLKELEFEFESIQNQIKKLAENLNKLSVEYDKGKNLINKRLNPINYKK